MNFLPIVERELRRAARRPGTYWLRFAAALGVCVLWLAVAFGGGSFPSVARLGKNMFDHLGLVVEVAALLAGVFLTADCLSEEKREGTLGLLFLAGLRGHDVVLGKLAASSVHALCALLAILPMLALPLLSGGISPEEFWRVVLAINATMFMSLSAGLLVSAVSREARSATGGVLLILVLLTCVLPTFNELLVILLQIQGCPPLLWPNPLYTYAAAFDARYVFQGGGVVAYWGSLGTQIGLGVAGLIAASMVLGRESRAGVPPAFPFPRWKSQTEWGRRDRPSPGYGPAGALPHAGSEGGQAGRLPYAGGEKCTLFARFGSPRVRRALRRRRLTANPYYWLASRDRLPRIVGVVLFGAVSALWFCLFFGIFIAPWPTNLEAFNGVLFMAFGLNLIFRYLVALEAGRRFNEDRRSGALELLLVTPLSKREMFAGQRRALFQHFKLPLVVLLAFNGALLWLVNGPDPVHAGIGGAASVARMYTVLFAGGMVMVVVDYLALNWAGMWLGLRVRQHHHAVLFTLALVCLVPWLVLLLPRIGRRGYLGPADEVSFLAWWYAVCILNDLVVVLWSRLNLQRHLRRLAAMPPAANDEPAAVPSTPGLDLADA